MARITKAVGTMLGLFRVKLQYSSKTHSLLLNVGFAVGTE